MKEHFVESDSRKNAPFKVIDSDSFIDMINDLVSCSDIDETFVREFHNVFSLGSGFDVYVVGIFADLVTVVEKWDGDTDALPTRRDSNDNIVGMSTFHPSHEFYKKWEFAEEDKGAFFSYYINKPSRFDTHRLDSLGTCISL